MCLCIICSCAQITNQKGYSHFGIQNLGECRSGPGVARSFASQGARVAYTHEGPKPWVGCLGKGMKQCKRPSLSCVGQDQTNYVYGLRDSKFHRRSTLIKFVRGSCSYYSLCVTIGNVSNFRH